MVYSLKGRRSIAINIDEIDAKIITSLLGNARKSFVKIAAETNLSTASISDRFSELEKNGVITGSTLQINQKALGRNTIYTISITVEKEIDEVMDYIRTIPFEIPFIFRDPKNKINFFAGFGEIDEITHLKETLRKNKFVRDLQVETWVGVKNVPENLQLLPNKTNVETTFKSYTEKQKHQLKLDKIDLQIIQKMTENSMQPFSKIANEIGTSINTVSRKYSNLVSNRIIRPVLQIDPKKLGYHAMVVFALSFASQSDMSSLIEAVMNIKDTFLVIKTSGNYDLFFQVFVRNIDQLLSTQNQVAGIQGISTIESTIYPIPTRWPLPGEYISTF